MTVWMGHNKPWLLWSWTTIKNAGTPIFICTVGVLHWRATLSITSSRGWRWQLTYPNPLRRTLQGQADAWLLLAWSWASLWGWWPAETAGSFGLWAWGIALCLWWSAKSIKAIQIVISRRYKRHDGNCTQQWRVFVFVACSKWLLNRHTQRCLLEWFTFQYIETFPFSNESRVAVHYINNSNSERIICHRLLLKD